MKKLGIVVSKETKMENKKHLCQECDADITKRVLIIREQFKRVEVLCASCKERLGDDFKWKMKTVGFDDEPTIAKTKEDWDLLEKQEPIKDI